MDTYRHSGVNSSGTLGRTSTLRTLYAVRPSEPYSQYNSTWPRIVSPNVDITMAISNYHIQFDNKDKFKPGEELAGKVIMDVWSTIDVKYVEFLISGRGTVRVFSSATTFIEKPRVETYINKKILLIRPKNGYPLVTLKPGRYVSNFRYNLPKDIPSTVHQFDMGHGYVFDISYCVQANVVATDPTRYNYDDPENSGLKVIKAVRQPFLVLPPHNWKDYPGSMEPIINKEHVSLMCSSTKEPASVTLTLNRGVFQVGDAINIQTLVHCPEYRRISRIRAELEQQLTFDKDMLSKYRQTMVSAEDDRRLRIFIGQEHTTRSQFKLHIPKNLVPSYLPHCHMLKINYNMKLTVSFKKLGGKLIIRVPLVIMPANYEDTKTQGSNGFTKPIMKFPYFSRRPEQFLSNGEATMAASQRQDDSTTESSEDLYIPEDVKGQITTKYEPSLSCCCLACLGIGIYNIEEE